jgi:1-hydroxycarotenoid 3,4-desaturase
VVFNGDVAALARGLLGAQVREATRAPAQRSLSAVTWNLVAPTSGFPLLRHNVFFSADYRAEFDALFQARRLPGAPTVYVCGHDRGSSEEPRAAGAPERLMCLVNAPSNGDTHRDDEDALQRCEEATFALLQHCGLQVARTGARSVRLTPHDFALRFPGTGGALYGAASHGWRASFSRPGSRSAVPGLYLAGGSTHPGPGVPMAALSGRQAAASLLHDWAARSRKVA